MTGAQKYKVLLVGNPNVGKSLLFYHITGKYASVSNYPGTTVSITKGTTKIGSHHELEIIDTPGFYNMITITEEENVTKKIILEERPDVILHVIDAKNIERMLPLTLQLLEANLPVILVLNMYDELKTRGLDIELSHLEHDLGIPVVCTIATKRYGLDNLISRIISVAEKRYKYQPITVEYSENIEKAITEVAGLIKSEYPISKRSIATLLLQNDNEAYNLLKDKENIEEIKAKVSEFYDKDINLRIAYDRHKMAAEIIKEHISEDKSVKKIKITELLDKLTLHPIFGFFAVFVILYFGFYKFVGGFGAGTLVDLIETKIFEELINPYVNAFFGKILGDSIFFNLFAGDYGMITLGVRYAFAIVLPVVSTFFLMFSIIEDSGFLVRISMLLDKILKKIGLSGRSVIPLILGLGCGTMATVVTRTLETKRERYLVTFLLALTIPCSAQLGVILGLLGDSFSMLMIWFISILVIFLISGYVLNKYTKGDGATFFMEVPPIRMPKFGNVMVKTFSRLKWYAFEIIPIFIYVSALIWIGKITKIFDFLTYVLTFPAKWAGLPDKMGEIFLYGFFRRDFGAAGLYDIQHLMTNKQMVVAAVVLTLFVPCVAQFAVMIKERGAKTSVLIFLSVIPFAFIFGILLNMLLTAWGY
ncbi:ferrous iron transport protein B [Deferribacterales bacterium Es71-Z0220]|uniref:ferrous iron transport protein B n=1 Tax=Deferrivibrio essentukiensis TaxID=2880922 RepID=UPI001F60AE30|nr:ferrous iron transport protein B [Deferrivibrio essentukiensis]MCB4204800.1 ferrous iron transport protein B [Deferrivibrio essentukiensis]